MPGKKILIVDDDPDLLEIMDYLLTEAGYETSLLLRGDHIIAQITLFCPDLILMDVMLAGMDGRLICQCIKSDIKNTMPVILISGTHNLRQVMQQAGAPNDFVAKPFDLDFLLSSVARQLA